MNDMAKKIYVCISIVIVIVLLLFGKGIMKYIERNAEYKIVRRLETDYVYYDRKITVDDLRQFDHDTTYEEMVESLGKENGRWGYGGAWPYYELYDGTYAICYCLSGTEMEQITIVDKKEKKYVLLECSDKWIMQ